MKDFILAAFFWLRKAKPLKASRPEIRASFGIQMSREEIKLEQEFNDEVIKFLESRIVVCGYFKKDKVAELVAKLKESSVPFGRVNTKTAFDGDTFLTVEEKRTLGLNTRMKYSKKLIEYFEPNSFKEIEPKAFLECMHLDAFHRMSRKKELRKLKVLGFVKKVKVVPVGDAGDCAKIKRLNKVYGIEEIPDFPLAGCDAPFCRCMYEAVIPNNF